MVSLIDPGGNVSTFGYDQVGRKIFETTPSAVFACRLHCIECVVSLILSRKAWIKWAAIHKDRKNIVLLTTYEN